MPDQPVLGVTGFDSALDKVYEARTKMIKAHEEKVKERSPGD
jgi:hypothetical protein